MGARHAVDYVEVLTLSYWLILALYLPQGLAFAFWAGRKSAPVLGTRSFSGD